VPLLVTGALPVGGPAFPVEVKGIPRPFGRIVARSGDRVLWPASRALAAAWFARPEQVTRPVEFSPPLPLSDHHRPVSFVRAFRFELALFVGALAFVGSVVVVTDDRGGEATRFRRTGTPVVAEVLEQGGKTVQVRYRLSDGEAPRTGSAPVEYGTHLRRGLRLPAVVHPQRPGELRLLREHYDRLEPRVWATLPALGIGSLLVRRGFDWRRSAAVARTGPWRRVTARRADRGWSVLVNICPSGEEWFSCAVRLAESPAPGLSRRAVVDMEVAGDLEPGAAVALSRKGRLYAVAGRALVPRPPEIWRIEPDISEE
jgi:hypothetical protein